MVQHLILCVNSLFLGIFIFYINPLLAGHNSGHFADESSKSIFIGNFRILIPISLKFVTKCLVDNKSILVQVLAGRRTGAEPLHEPKLTQFRDEYMRR